MTEGWHGDEYLVLLSDDEVAPMTSQYELGNFLPGFQLVGLRGWDDFIVRDGHGKLFTAQTIPLDAQNLKPLETSIDTRSIRPDDQLSGRVKWYIKPLIFGGDPQAKDNMIWLNFQQHAEAVRWWNQKYLEAKHASISTRNPNS